MSKATTFFAAVLCGLGVLGPVGALRAADPPLFPLKKGQKWVYQTNIAGGEDLKSKNIRQTFDVGDTVLFNGVECTELIQKDADGKKSEEIRYLAVQNGFLTEVGKKVYGSDKTYIFTNKPADKLLKLTADGPAAWASEPNTVFEGKESFGSRFELRQDADTVEVGGAKVKGVLVVQIESPNSKTKRWYVPGKGLVKEQLFKKDSLVYEGVLVSFTGGGAVEIGAVTLNPAVVEKEASVEAVEAPPGVVTEFKKSRTIKREVSYSTKVGAAAEVEARLGADLAVVKGELGLKVKSSVEAAVGEKLSDSETREQTVRIDGKELPKAKIIWIDVYRTGSVEVTQDGKSYKVPFEFPLGTKLVIRKP